MNINKRKPFIASFGLAIYLLSCLIRLDGVVLCLGQDGHIQLERATPNLNCKVSLPEQGVESTLSVPKDLTNQYHCGPCKDIPLSLIAPETVAIASLIQIESIKTPLITTVRSDISAFVVQAAISTDPIQHFSAPNFSLVALRTVILLI